MQDLSYENYTLPTDGGIDIPLTKYQEIAEKVKAIANEYDVEFVFATREGVYATKTKDSEVLKEIEAKIIEINGRADNVRMYN